MIELNGLVDPRVHSLLKKSREGNLIQVIPIQGKVQVLSKIKGIKPDARKGERKIHSHPDRYHLALHVLRIVQQIPKGKHHPFLSRVVLEIRKACSKLSLSKKKTELESRN